MKPFLCITVLVGFVQIPFAYAQQGGGTPPAYTAGPLAPGNCGTPDTPKACGPMAPTHALLRYHHPSHQPQHHRAQSTTS
jgi:hypothetical protein